MLISNISDTKNVLSNQNSTLRNKESNSFKREIHDTVTISDEAKALYNSQTSNNTNLTDTINNDIQKAIQNAKILASQDNRDERNTLEFYSISPTVFKYVPSALKAMNNDFIGKPASFLPSREECKIANENLTKIYDVFNKAYDNIGIDMNNLSIKEKFYLMKDESINNMIETEFLSILSSTNQLYLSKC